MNSDCGILRQQLMYCRITKLQFHIIQVFCIDWSFHYANQAIVLLNVQITLNLFDWQLDYSSSLMSLLDLVYTYGTIKQDSIEPQ